MILKHRWWWLCLLCVASLAWAADPNRWIKLKDDGLHDPKGEGVELKQEPGEALSPLPFDPEVGNQVRWVKALEDGLINPRTNIFPETKVNILDLDIILNKKGGMAMVRFPHRPHTLWLDCVNCHEHIFSYKAGESQISMFNILMGEQCGVCHGAVAFPLTECARCHNVPHDSPLGRAAKASPLPAPAFGPGGGSVKPGLPRPGEDPPAGAKPAAKPAAAPAAAPADPKGKR